MRVFTLQGKQYCLAPSKQRSAMRCSDVISTLISRIDAGCLWCALKALNKNIFEKPKLRGKSVCKLISKAG